MLNYRTALAYIFRSRHWFTNWSRHYDQAQLISAWRVDSQFENCAMSNSKFFQLTDTQMARLEPNVPEASAKPRLGGLRVMSGITFKNPNVLKWRHPLEL